MVSDTCASMYLLLVPTVQGLCLACAFAPAGWGVFRSEDICCAPGASFAEGCSVTSNTTTTAAANPAPGAKANPAARTEAGPVAVQPVAVVPAVVQPAAIPQAVPVVPIATAPLPKTSPGAGKK